MKKNKEEEKGFFKKLIENVTENVVEGAAFVSEKVIETSAKAYEAGSELVAETSEKIHDFTTKQAMQKELNRLTKRQKELVSVFGKSTLEYYLKNDAVKKSFLTTQKMSSLVEEYTSNSTKMEKLENELNNL